MNWIECDKELPKEVTEGQCSYSEMVDVLLSTGEQSEDWLINHKWVQHCRLDTVGGYPIKWRYKE